MASSSSVSVPAIINFAYSAVYVLLYLLFVPLFLLKRHQEPIRGRVWLLSVLQMSWVVIDIAILSNLPNHILPCFFRMLNGIFTIPIWIFPYFFRCAVVWYKFRLQEMMLKQRTNSPAFRRLAWVQRNSWMVSPLAQACFFALLLVLALASTLIVYFTNLDVVDTTCHPDALVYLVIVQGVLAMVLVFTATFFLWNISDAYLIKHELTCMLFAGVPVLILWALANFLEWGGVANSSFWVVNLQVLSICVTICMPVVGAFVMNRFKMRKSPSSDERSITSSIQKNEDEFHLVLQDETLMPDFENFIVSAWAVENLLFYRAVETYREIDPALQIDMAKKILQDFVLEGSPLEINVDMGVRTEIEQAVASSEVDDTTFNAAEKHALQLLRYSLFPMWKESPRFRELLKKNKVKDLMELKKTQGSGKSNTRKHVEGDPSPAIMGHEF